MNSLFWNGTLQLDILLLTRLMSWLLLIFTVTFTFTISALNAVFLSLGVFVTFGLLHKDVVTACDFFTAEVFTATGLITFYVLFFIQIGSRKVHIAGITPHPNESWMKHIARNLTMDEWGFLQGQKYM